MPRRRSPTDDDFRRLLSFRTALRRFLRWSEEQAAAAGLSAVQHQLLLAVRGHGGDCAPTIGDVAEQLLLRHHSAVELVDRAEAAGLVRREHDPDDRRVVHVHLTADGARRLRRLTQLTLEHLAGDPAWQHHGRQYEEVTRAHAR